MQFNLSIDLRPIQAMLNEAYGELAGPGSPFAEVVEATAHQLIAEWRKQATIALSSSGAAGYTSPRWMDETPQYPFDGDALHAVVENRHPAAVYLELGTQPFDQKKMLFTSGKAKISKDGKRFIRIPFEHSRASLDTYGVGEEASQLSPSSNLPSSSGFKTKWGDRLKSNVGIRSKTFSFPTGEAGRTLPKGPSMLGGTGGSTQVQYTWKAGPFQNMVRFVDKGGATRGYMTFRTISEKNDVDAWMHPGLKASHIAEAAVNEVRPLFIRQIASFTPEAFRRIGLIP